MSNVDTGVIETIGNGLTSSIESARNLASSLILPKSKSGLIKRIIIAGLIVVAVLWVIGKMQEKKSEAA